MGVIIKNYVKNLKNEKAQYIFIGFPLIISIIKFIDECGIIVYLK